MAETSFDPGGSAPQALSIRVHPTRTYVKEARSSRATATPPAIARLTRRP